MSVPTSLIFKTMSNRKAFSRRSFVLKLKPHHMLKKVPIFVIFLMIQNVNDVAWWNNQCANRAKREPIVWSFVTIHNIIDLAWPNSQAIGGHSREQPGQVHAVVGKQPAWPPVADSSSALDWAFNLERKRKINSEAEVSWGLMFAEVTKYKYLLIGT